MQDVVYIEDVERAGVLLKPRRVELLRLLAEPHSLGELATITGETPQKLYYHVKVLEKAALVQQVGERQSGVMAEAIYQAVARSYWLAPQVIDQAGGRRRATDDLSLSFLLGLAEEMQRELGRLAGEAVLREGPSLGLDLHVHLPAEQREAFAEDVQRMFQSIAEKYGIRDDRAGETFRVVLACYPDEPEE